MRVWMPDKVVEEVVNVALARLLEEAGIRAPALVKMNKVPDVYLVHRGIRTIIETKEEGHRKALEDQMKERLEDNLCELVIGITYPTSVVRGTITAPTVRTVERSLREAKLKIS